MNSIGRTFTMVSAFALPQEGKEIIRVAPNFTWTTSCTGWPQPESELGFSLARWNEYRRRFQVLRLEAGILRPRDDPNAIYLMAQTKGLIIGGSSKGYAYSELPLEPLCYSLDQDSGRGDIGICFKPVDANWYVYLEWD